MYISIATTLVAITAASSSSSVVAFQSPIGRLPVTTTTHKSQLSTNQFAAQYQLQPYQQSIISSTSLYNLKGDDYLNSLNEDTAKTPTPPSESKQVGGGTASIPNEIFNLVKSIVGAGVLSLPAGTYYILMFIYVVCLDIVLGV